MTTQTETALLALCVQAYDLLPSILQEVDNTDLADKNNRLIFETMRRINSSDTALLIDALKAQGKLDQVGGSAYVSSLKFYQAESHHLDSYIDELKTSRRRERYLHALRMALKEAETSAESLDYLTAKHESELLPHLRYSAGFSETTQADRAALAFNHVETALRTGSKLLGIDSGFEPFNDLTGGLIEGGYTLILGVPGAGKTALWLQLAQHVARTHSPVAMIQLEMSQKLIALRQVAQMSSIGVDRLQKGDVTENELGILAQHMDRFINSGNEIYALNPSVTQWSDIARWTRQKHTDNGVKTLWIDNLKLVDGLRGQSELEKFQYVSRQCRLLAMELNIHIVAIHHVTKIPVGRPITVNDAYGSGAFRQDADTVILMNRDTESGYIILETGKARHGIEGLKREVIFTGATQKFVEKERTNRGF